MDILLTHGYCLHEDPQELKVLRPYPPLGILYISAYLKRAGFAVGVHDGTFGGRADYPQLLESEKPGIVGIYGTLMTRQSVLRMIHLACERRVRVVLGGPEPAAYAEEYLRHGADVIVFGEGEAALEELIPQIASHGVHRLDSVTGIAFRAEDGTIVRTAARPMLANLDALPEPDRDAIDLHRYLETWRRHHGASSLSLICSRGCPYRCDWCSHSVFGHTHRRRSPPRVADEAASLVQRYQPDQLWYSDDVFTIHKSWLVEYAAALKERQLKIPFECISRADRLDDAVADLLASMGCRRVWIGSESGSQRILDAMRREVTVEQVQWATQALKRRGIETGMFIMLGYEGEQEEDIEATVEHLKKAAPDVFLTTVAYPIRDTEYYSKIRTRISLDKPWAQSSDRDFRIRGRRSSRYYGFANRWMVNSVALHRQRGSSGNLWLRIKAALNVATGRVGMRWTRGETEPGAGSGT